jgi:DNA primase
MLGFWFGTPEGDLLTELAGREPLEDAEGQAALFSALFNRLIQESELASLRRRHNELKAKPYAELSKEEKRELLDLTHKIRAVSGKT